MASPSLIVFGSQTIWPSSEYLGELWVSLVREPRLSTFANALKQLPDLWETLLKSNPRLHRVPGRESMRDLRQWIDTGHFPATIEPVPSILSTPMTIIIHTVQYIDYLKDNSNAFPTHSDLLRSLQLGGVQGFCTGFLTAIAVACSKNEKDIDELGAVALRLALCIGAYVDLDGAYATPPNETCWLAVRWRHEVEKDRVLNILKSYPDAYISVNIDSRSITVTTPRSDFASLSQQLSVNGLKVRPVGLSGRFHSTVHCRNVGLILDLCDSHSGLQFPTASSLLVPLRSNSDAQVITTGSLHELALKAILTDISNWHLTIVGAASQLTLAETPLAIHVGLVDSIPSSVIREYRLKTNKLGPARLLSSGMTASLDMPISGAMTPAVSEPQESRYPNHAIAVVGMACKFPGANSIDDFWKIIAAGTSMCEQMPLTRFSPEGLRRSTDKLKFWGNFISDIDSFDHKFFKKSSREAASMDPQQRLLLQVAYQAMESAGYFGEASPPDDIGVYLGVCANDYNDNVASHPPNAYSSLGTLRAFLSGKISHFFGWTSPSITYDTACSSSAVAIHAACKALEAGDCSRAVAGGVSLYTNPNFYQNLAAASFLSPTGPTKPFDAKGDGYCRGEGAGLVVLKRLSDAIADGDTVMGVISGIAVNQNMNCTNITVPHGGSQVILYRKVSLLAGVNPEEVTFVEAHGTGTPVGDPIEFESIRKVFGGPQRDQLLHVASVKGNIGHLEGASGVAALIKTILMMKHSTIPVHANFSTLNPKIPLSDADRYRVAIPTRTQKWESTFRVACINNYGAAGSNAAMIVCQGPEKSILPGRDMECRHVSLPKYPLFISANSIASLAAYCSSLQEKLSQLSSELPEKEIVPSLTFNLADKQNHSLPHALAVAVSSLAELKMQLSVGAAGSSPSHVEIATPKTKPLVLVFGGQVGKSIGLSKEVYQTSVLLRSHLDQCDNILRSTGMKGLYPHLFQSEPVEDIINLHSMLFSLQYACAKSWIDSGVKVDALVGHSFGQLTALCVSGSLTLQDGIKLVSGRATLMQRCWGVERGSMISIDAELDLVLGLCSSINKAGSRHKIEIACYNGPTSYVLVGTEASIRALEAKLMHHVGSLKYKKLNVTHGFHSQFTEPLLPSLAELAESLEFHEPNIPIETCSENRSWSRPEPWLIAEHTRSPVYFGKAVDRLTQRLGACTWLEAGSSTSVTGIVRRALGATGSVSHAFHGTNLTLSGGGGSLAEVTVHLWKAGHKVQFWPFHRSQRHEYSPVILPPYQFEKPRHWLTWVDSATEVPAALEPIPEIRDPTLLSFVRYLDSSQRQAEFCVNPRSEQYKLYVQGHAVLAEPLCPAPLYVELVSHAATIVNGSPESLAYIPCVEDLEIKAPLGMNDRSISMFLTRVDGATHTWNFLLRSQSHESGPGKSAVLQHATGKVVLETETPKMMAEFDRYERLIGHRRYDDLMDDPESEAMQGALVYKVFGKVVTYKEYYKGVRKVFAKGQEVAGLVTLPGHDIKALNNTICNPLAVDNFIQVSGLHVNSLSEIGDNEVFVCTKVDRIQPGPQFGQVDADSQSWTVYSNFHRMSEKELINDIFVFDIKSKGLAMIILGVRFTKVSVGSLTKVLSRANVDGSETKATDAPPLSHTAPQARTIVGEAQTLTMPTEHDVVPLIVEPVLESRPTMDVDLELRKLLHKVTEVPMDALSIDSTLEELGIDSLMITEVLGEISITFGIEIPTDDPLNLVNIRSLWQYLRSRGIGGSSQGQPGAETDTELTTSIPSSVMSGTPSTPTSTKNTSTIDLPQLAKDAEFKNSALSAVAQRQDGSGGKSPAASGGHSTPLIGAQQAFEQIRYDYDMYTEQTGFAKFWKQVYPTQARLVLAYIVEAFATCSCPLASLRPDQKLPPLRYLPKHSMLVAQLYKILEDGNLIHSKDGDFVRSNTAIDTTPAAAFFEEALEVFPQHASEHKLLHITASRLGDCLVGAADPLQLLFRSKSNKEILEDVYANGPMYKAISQLLGSFLIKAFANPPEGGKFNILELGGGTGGTTKYIVDFLAGQGVPFSYTFTDLSGSLVAAAKKTFAGRDMKFMVVDIEKEPPEELLNNYHCVISTNCIHATRDLTLSARHMRQMLQVGGFVSLVEFTKNIYWFDLVFGLLDGWWLFEDGRKHVLASEWFWHNSMKSAGFKHVTWTDGRSEEARTLRIITGFVDEAEGDDLKPKKAPPKLECETVVYKQVGNNSLLADIYYPQDISAAKRPIALLIHGGGHVMFTRKEVHPKQVRLLLEQGFVPVSIEYRFCPEINIIDGPMTDVCDALQWCRNTLPTMTSNHSELQIDGNKIAVIGWSTGGHLAMTIPSSAMQRGIKPPEVILAFYAPLILESDWWQNPIYPTISISSPSEEYDLLEGVQDEPISDYYPPSNKNHWGQMMTLEDPRWRFVLHMNWKAQTLPLLLNGLPSKKQLAGANAKAVQALPMPPMEKIMEISPHAQIIRGHYHTPTFVIHGTADELIPWEHSQQVVNALKSRGIPAGIYVLEDAAHLFDSFPPSSGFGQEAVQAGYEFIFSHIWYTTS